MIGEHDGATFLTLGERHGFTITKKGTSDKPMYVVAKDIKTNTITVSDSPILLKSNQKEFELENVNWISGIPKVGKAYDAQVRYHQDYQKCKINSNKITFSDPQIAASGQSIVVYDKNLCIGGGVIK